MDLLTLGLGRQKRSGELSLLREISRNSAISWRLDFQLKRLNSATSVFLRSPRTLAAISTETLESVEVRDAFQDIFYLLHIDDYRRNTAFSISLEHLAKCYTKVKNVDNGISLKVDPINLLDVAVSPSTLSGQSTTASEGESSASASPVKSHVSTQDRIDVQTQTLALIDHYVLLIAALHISNDLILDSLRIKSNLVYWESLQASTRAKLVYLVQTGPSKLMGAALLLYRYVIAKLAHQSLAYSQKDSETSGSSRTWTSFRYTAQVAWHFTSKLIERAWVELFPATAMMTSKVSWTHRYKRLVRSIVQSPLRFVNADVSRQITTANASLASKSAAIDSILRADFSSTAQLLAVLAQTTETDQSGTDRGQIAAILDRAARIPVNKTDIGAPPSFLSRYWPLMFLLVRYGPSQTVSAYTNRDQIYQWVKYNLIDTCSGFVSNWLVKPFRDMLGILRSDNDLTLTSKESLDSDLNSLERMIADYVSDEHITGITRQQIHNQVRSGDLTSLMSRYEEDIRLPVKSLVKGSLVRAILIQVQKTKVDGGVALNGIDKLLKSQQLVFGVVSVSPSLFIVYTLWTYLTKGKPLVVNGKQLNYVCIKALNDIENYLVLTKQKELDAMHTSQAAYEAKILVEVVNLIIILKPLIPQQMKRDWTRDLNDLTNTSFQTDTKLDLVRKIWNVYGPFFRVSV